MKKGPPPEAEINIYHLPKEAQKLFLDPETGSDVKDMPIADRKDLMRFMMAFSSECAVYVGGPDDQNNPAIMIHGIPDLPGAVEISPGSKIYQGMYTFFENCKSHYQ